MHYVIGRYFGEWYDVVYSYDIKHTVEKFEPIWSNDYLMYVAM